MILHLNKSQPLNDQLMENSKIYFKLNSFEDYLQK